MRPDDSFFSWAASSSSTSPTGQAAAVGRAGSALLLWQLHWDGLAGRFQLRRIIGEVAWEVLHQGSEPDGPPAECLATAYSTSAPRTPRIDNHAHRYRPSLVPVSAAKSAPPPANRLRTTCAVRLSSALPRPMNEPPHAPTYRSRHRVRRKAAQASPPRLRACPWIATAAPNDLVPPLSAAWVSVAIPVRARTC